MDLNIILPILSIMFQVYNIMSYIASFDCSHMLLHYPRNKREKNQNIRVQVYYNIFALILELEL